MRAEEIKRIEERLTVDLPAHYIAFISKFEGLDNSENDVEHFLYSKADDVIDMNHSVGFHLNEKIIRGKLIIGDNRGGDFYLIDLVDPSDTKVYVFDHEESVEKNFNVETGKFDWDRFDKYDTLDGYRNSLQELFE